MIADLLPVRLVWSQSHGGFARMHDAQVSLKQAPDIGVPDVIALDFSPGMICTVQTKFEAERDMRQTEREAAERVLRELTAE